MKWWALQDRDDPEPYAVMALDDQGLPRRYVPGEGLVHWPALAMFIFGGETGAKPIEEPEATQLIEQGIGAIDPGFVIMARGQAPTIPAPGEDEDAEPTPDGDEPAATKPEEAPTEEPDPAQPAT